MLEFPKDLSLVHACFLIFINDLSNALLSNVKSFADDTPPFSVKHVISNFASELNSGLIVRKSMVGTSIGRRTSNSSCDSSKSVVMD